MPRSIGSQTIGIALLMVFGSGARCVKRRTLDNQSLSCSFAIVSCRKRDEPSAIAKLPRLHARAADEQGVESVWEATPLNEALKAAG